MLKKISKIVTFIQWFAPIKFKIEHVIGIKKEDKNYYWIESDPQILLRPYSAITPPLTGFYMLELEYEGASSGVSKLYVDYSDGYMEKNAISILMQQSGITKRIVHFKKQVKSIRWDPAEEKGHVNNPRIKFVKLTKSKAKRLIVKKLALVNDQTPELTTFQSLYQNYNDYFESKQLQSNQYQSWIDNIESNLWLPLSQAQDILFSIIVPTYNSKKEWLMSLWESLDSQIYKNFEVIFVDDCSTNKETIHTLQKINAADTRVRIKFMPENGHICKATNEGVKLAIGDFVLFLDHDDALSPFALNELASEIIKNPDLKFIYSDEDFISEMGDRISPHFKSDLNLDLLYSHNYITHLACYSAQLLKTLEGFREGYEGAQDYDLALRATNLLSKHEVSHISKVLYHWRMVEGSTAKNSDAKNYTANAGKRALEDHLKQKFPTQDLAVLHTERNNYYRVNWPLPKKLPLVSIVIPTKDGLDVLKPCISSLLSVTSYQNYEVIVVDNGSTCAETLSYLDTIKSERCRIVRDDNEFNYSEINNRAIKYTKGELICLMNNDIEIIQNDWLDEMVSLAIRQDVGCVGAKLLYPDMTIQHAGVILGLGGYAAHSHRGKKRYDSGYFCRPQIRQELSAVTAACLLIRKELYIKVGGLNPEFKVAYNDVDFCLRVNELGYKNIYTPFAELIHHESKTRGLDDKGEKARRLKNEKRLLELKWSNKLLNDPFYNSNLTTSAEDFSIKV